MRCKLFLVGTGVLLTLACLTNASQVWARGPGGGRSGGSMGGSFGGMSGGSRSFGGLEHSNFGNFGATRGFENFGSMNRGFEGANVLGNGEHAFSTYAGHPWNNEGWYNGHNGFYRYGYYPFFGLGWGGWGYGYPWYDSYASYGYDPNDYNTIVPDQYTTYGQQPTVSPETAVGGEEQSSLGAEFLNRALEAFHNGQYAEAVRWANHASVEMPKNAKVHELASLALFALKDYRGANMEAHAALTLGPAANWDTLYAYYNDLPTYNQQLDALVAYLNDHPKAADARFVLAYQDMMMGHQEAARDELGQIAKVVSQDKLAIQLLQKLGGQVPGASAATPTAPQPRIGSRIEQQR